jgi:uncharacterized protein (UPF0332 family)
MNEIKELVGRANKYLSSAKLLLDSGDYESSVSRSYYAMFFATEAVLLTKELEFSSHRGVISAFGQHFVKTGIFSKEMRRLLQNAFDMRQKGDYSFRPMIQEATANQILNKANEFVSQIIGYLKEGGYEL